MRSVIVVMFLLFLAGFGSGRSNEMMTQDDVDAPMVPPPKNAVVLFDGNDLSKWVARNGGEAKWEVKEGYVQVVPKTGDIHTKEPFTDFQLHVEFWLPHMPEAKGQARANSGVYLQGRYEVQVLDSYGLSSQDNDCGGIYKVAAPLVNACKKPERWQSYDIAFRAPRVDAHGQKKENARATVFHNGVIIHNHLDIPGPTGGALATDETRPGPLLLQEHGNLVRYRNVWIVPVP
jgi:hypothetical protein